MSEGFERIKRKVRTFKRAYDQRALRAHNAEQSARDHGCRKRAHASKHEAETCLSRQRAKGYKLTAAYHCRFCGSWHLTSQEQR